jgi:hypothetical protein
MSCRQIPQQGILSDTSARGLISCRGLLVEAPGLLVGDRALFCFEQRPTGGTAVGGRGSEVKAVEADVGTLI